MVTNNLILPSGVNVIDKILAGGIRGGVFTHVFGEAASGKTTLALQFVRNAMRLDLAVIYVNTESTSPVERLEQVAGKDMESMKSHLQILIPHSFDEQGTIIEDLELYMKSNTKLVVFDTLTRLYRTVLDDKKSNYAAHRELNRHCGFLKGVAKNNGVAVLALNQVTASMNGMNRFEPVASNILDYWSDVVVRIRTRPERGERLLERLVPDGEPSKGLVHITSEGLSTKDHTVERVK